MYHVILRPGHYGSGSEVTPASSHETLAEAIAACARMPRHRVVEADADATFEGWWLDRAPSAGPGPYVVRPREANLDLPSVQEGIATLAEAVSIAREADRLYAQQGWTHEILDARGARVALR